MCAEAHKRNLDGSKDRKNVNDKHIEARIRHVSHVPVWMLKSRLMKRAGHRLSAYSRVQGVASRARVRCAVTWRVDTATAQGKVGLGLVRNLSVHGMSIDSALRHTAHEV